jgi:transcription elongation GreA/GreB family factor
MENQKRNAVSPDFYQFIVNETEKLEIELNELREDIKHLADTGCLADDYDSQPEIAMEMQLQIALQQAKLRLEGCVVVPKPENNFQVQIGSQIELFFDNHRQIVRLEGVGGRPDICSLQSPLGCQIIGARVGDVFEVKDKKFKIINIF